MGITDSNIKKLLFLLAISILCLPAYSNFFSKDSISHKKGIAIGMNISSTGPGIFVSKSIADRFDVRLNASNMWYSYDLSKLSTELQGNADLRLGVVGGFVDYYLFRFLYLSGGVSYNLTRVGILGQLNKSIFVGDIQLEPEDVGEISVEITPGWKTNPYLGLGLNFRHTKHFSFGIEFGVFFQGPPEVKLHATGMLTPTASAEQESLMEQNISPLIYYPNLALRFSYHIQSRKR